MSNLRFLFYSFFFHFCLPTSLVAKEIVVNKTFSSQAIGTYVELLEDKSKILTISDLLNGNAYEYEQQNHRELLVGSRRNANIWVKIPISNSTNQVVDLRLRAGDTYLRFMWAYVTDGQEVLQEYLGGLQMSFQDRTVLHRNSVFPILIPPQSKRIVFLKIDGRWDSMQFPIELSTLKEFEKNSQAENMYFGLFFGFLGMIVFISLILFILTKTKLLGWYFLYTFCSLFYYISISGFDFQYLIPDYPMVAHHSKLTFAILSSFFLYPMILEYFKEEKGIWLAKKCYNFFVFIMTTLLLLIVFQDFTLSVASDEALKYNFFPVLILGLFSLFLLFTLVKIVYDRPIWQHVLYLLGYSLIILVMVLAVFFNNGLITTPISGLTLSIIATSLEIMCLSILFFEKVWKLRKEKQALDAEIKIARLERDKADKIRELDQAKTRLYTNITHEFRTPLTVIKGLTDQIEGNVDKKDLIQRNSDILLRLINQLLDLSKADKGELSFHPIQNDAIQYIRYLSESFRSWGAVKNIRLHFLPEIKECWMDYDPNKLQEVLSNLLSNAIKNTEKGGDVYIILKKVAQQLIIIVKDTGIGIDAKYLPHLFDRFFQVDQTNASTDVGSGIGLALCKELVQIMNGEIKIKSEPGIGSEFEVNLPITQNAPIQEPLKLSIPEAALLADDIPSNKKTSISFLTHINQDEKLPTILIVEDNQDVRHYLTICLEKYFNLTVAENGKIGIQKAIEFIPDLILSDVMMPDTNGLELCEALKTNIITSHIPIILLTAKADQKAKIQGISRGADAYLTKPFNKEELLIRIQSLIEQRSRIQAHFLKNTNLVKAQKYAQEDKFLSKIKKAVLENLSNEDFDVQRLAFEIGMSRSQIYRKIKALTGRSIASYIRYLRLQAGKKLLETTNKTISEVAFEVGFNDLSYFSNSFSQEFGYPPNATRK